MTRYQHTHDDLIIVVGSGETYFDTPENFTLDAGAPPPGIAGVYYAPGGPQCRMDANGNQWAHGMNAGHVTRALAAISNVAALIAAQSSRMEAARAAAKAAADTLLTIQQKREVEYNNRGVTVAALAVALWEQIIEGRPEAAAIIQAKRAAVKAAIK